MDMDRHNRKILYNPENMKMNQIKRLLTGLFILLISVPALAQNAEVVEEITALSQKKWEWMADKNVDELANLFHENARFVHMSGSWGTDRELEIIESGSIWYKNTDVHQVVVETFGDTVILWNRITLEAEVRGNVVSNEFTVTEVYQDQDGEWSLLDLTFSSVRDTHSIEE
jgi:hypothetical protein